MANKDYVVDAAVLALTDYLAREGSEGTVRAATYNGSFDVLRAVKGNPKVSIIIPTAGRPATIRGASVDLLVNCVQSIAASTYRNVEIIAVHNGDLGPQTMEGLAPSDVKLVTYTEPFNVARKMNIGAGAASGDILLFLNDDVEVVSPGWLEAMIGLVQKPGVGCVGAKLLFESGQIQHVGVTFAAGLPDHVLRGAPREDPGYFFSNVSCRNWSSVTGACVMLTKAVFPSQSVASPRTSRSIITTSIFA